MVESICVLLLLFATFWFGYRTGYDRGVDDKQFDRATRRMTGRLNE